MHRRESTIEEEQLTGLRFLFRAGADSSSPLVVLVHGRAGNRSVMWSFERLIPAGCHVVSFEAFLPDPIGGWSWWDISNGGAQVAKGERIALAAGRLTRAIEALIAQQGLTPKIVVGAGFSQGSFLLSTVALRGFFSFSGVAILAGGLLSETMEIREVKDRPQLFVAHGRSDETIKVEHAREGVVWLRQQGLSVEYVEEDVGHKVGIEGTRALKEWLRASVGE
jgi:phospholipase/carboxylesterase